MELRSFLTGELAIYMKELRACNPEKSFRVILGDAKYMKDRKEPYLAYADALDFLCEETKELGVRADALLLDKPELVTCRSLSRVLLALYSFKLKRISPWVAGAIAAVIIISLTVLGILAWGSR